MTYDLRLMVGLGNPGPKYNNTRHNTGFIIIDALAGQQGAKWKFNKKFNAEVAEIENAILIKPQTYMNNSGQAVRAVMDYYKLLPKKLGLFTQKGADLSDTLIIVHDDVDFELGTFKIQKNRSSAGHQGVQSVINHLKTQNFTRARIGIKRITHNVERTTSTEKFILEKFSREEMGKLKKIMPNIIEGIIKILNIEY